MRSRRSFSDKVITFGACGQRSERAAPIAVASGDDLIDRRSY